MTPQEFSKWLYPIALTFEQTTHVPALFLVAQAAVESGWNKSAIGKNLFGITAGPSWTGKKQLVQTTEYHDTKDVKYPEIISIVWDANYKKWRYSCKRYFRDYDTTEECLRDHFKILSQPNFKPAFAFLPDIKLFAQAIQKGGYATDPHYADTIMSVVNSVKRHLGI